MNLLRLCVIQADLCWHDPVRNRDHFRREILNKAGKADVFLLPEMFTTGFTMQPELVAESVDGPTTLWMEELSRETNALILGSIVIQENGRYRNRLLWRQPDAGGHYDKKHLFSYAGEDKAYSAGEESILIHWLGWKIKPFICFDLRFPVWCRNTETYDLAVFSANWPTARIEAWDSLLKARAIENQCYVAGVNRVGKDPQIAYPGHSQLVRYDGQVEMLPIEKEATQIFELSLDALTQWRKAFPFLEERDHFIWDY